VNDAPNDDENQGERDTSAPAVPAKSNSIRSRFAPILGILGFLGSCICFYAALGLDHLVGAVMLALTNYVPDYVVVGSVFALGMIGWGFLMKAIKADIPGAWLWFTSGWAGFACLAYSWALSQRDKQQAPSGWTWLGTVFWLVCIGTSIATRKSDKKEKSQG
jgi:hypothetical protein